MRILAVDPGTYQSGWCVYETEGMQVGAKGVDMNRDMFGVLYTMGGTDVVLVIEMVGHYGSGMSVGKEVFHTCMWIGRMVESWITRYSTNPVLILRKTIATVICGFAKAKPTNISTAIKDRYPATGGGKTPQVGTKGQPGPLYGVKSHIWSALAVAIAYSEMSEALREEKKIPLLLLPENQG